VNFSTERDHAFFGLITLLGARPQAILSDNLVIEQFVIACASWDRPPSADVVTEGIRGVLGAIIEHNQGLWRRVTGRMDASMVRMMHNIFRLPVL
jgi:hypothetical protein